jgi:hypothetical protein
MVKLALIHRLFTFASGFLDRDTRRSRARLAGFGLIGLALLWVRSVQKADDARDHREHKRLARAKLIARKQEARRNALRRRTKRDDS